MTGPIARVARTERLALVVGAFFGIALVLFVALIPVGAPVTIVDAGSTIDLPPGTSGGPSVVIFEFNLTRPSLLHGSLVSSVGLFGFGLVIGTPRSVTGYLCGLSHTNCTVAVESGPTGLYAANASRSFDLGSLPLDINGVSDVLPAGAWELLLDNFSPLPVLVHVTSDLAAVPAPVL